MSSIYPAIVALWPAKAKLQGRCTQCQYPWYDGDCECDVPWTAEDQQQCQEAEKAYAEVEDTEDASRERGIKARLEKERVLRLINQKLTISPEELYILLWGRR